MCLALCDKAARQQLFASQQNRGGPLLVYPNFFGMFSCFFGFRKKGKKEGEKGMEGKGRKGKEMQGKEGEGKEGKGRKGKEREGKGRKGKEREGRREEGLRKD